MRSLVIIIILPILLSLHEKENLYGKWDLIEYEAIDAIRNSDGYLLGDFKTQNLADAMFNLVLDSMYYEFKLDTLNYIDIDMDKTIQRRAIWSLNKDTLNVKEIDRIYFRKYLVKKLTKDSLWFNVVFEDGNVSKHSYKFTKIE